MKATFSATLISSVILFNACNTKAVKEELKPEAAKKGTALIIGNPLDCGIENMSIFPVGSNYKPQVYEGANTEVNAISVGTVAFCANASTFNDRLAQEEYVNRNENEFDIRNILFYDLKTGQTYPLVSDTFHILSFALHKEFTNPLIFYRVVKKDFNKDSVYNSKDPVMLFVSNLYGKNLTQITPDNEQFVDYFYYADTQKILIKSAIDADNNKEFSNTDETNFREMNIKEPKMGKDIFTKSLKDSLRVL